MHRNRPRKYSGRHGESLATEIFGDPKMLKAICAATAIALASSSFAASPAPVQHRYLVERTFPAGALDGVDAAVKQKVNANNRTLDVTWEKSYVNAAKTKTYCV